MLASYLSPKIEGSVACLFIVPVINIAFCAVLNCLSAVLTALLYYRALHYYCPGCLCHVVYRARVHVSMFAVAPFNKCKRCSTQHSAAFAAINTYGYNRFDTQYGVLYDNKHDQTIGDSARPFVVNASAEWRTRMENGLLSLYAVFVRPCTPVLRVLVDNGSTHM